LKTIDDPFFYHEIHSPSGTSLYSCKFLNLHQIAPAVLNTEVKVFVRYTNGEVSLEKIDNWMKLYGELCSESRYLLVLSRNSIHFQYRFNPLSSFGQSRIEGLNSEVYSVNLKLKYNIPEFLPLYGKKARVYYHGIPPFCTNCYLIGKTLIDISLSQISQTYKLSGHNKSDCKNDSKDWWSFIVHLKAAKVPESYFGSWVEGQDTSKPSASSTGPELPADPNLVALLVKQLQTPTALSQLTQGEVTSKNKKKKRERSSSSSSSAESATPVPPNPPVLSFNQGRGFRGRGRGRGRYTYNRGYGYGRGRGFYSQGAAEIIPPPAEPAQDKKKSKKDKKEKKKSKNQ